MTEAQASSLEVTPRKLRDFGLVMAVMIAGIFGLVFPLLKRRDLPLVPWLIALLFVASAFAYPRSLTHVYRFWMWLGRILGTINSRIILTILFWGIVTPLSLLMKVIRRDILRLKYRDPNVPTYRIASTATDPRQGMERPF